MADICPNRGCSAIYRLSADDEGKTFACKDCGAQLHYDGDSLELVDAPRSAPTPAPAAASSSSSSPQPGPSSSGNPRSYEAPMSTQPNGGPNSSFSLWIFGIGTVCILVFLFLPILDRTSILRTQAEIRAGDSEAGEPFGRGPGGIGFPAGEDVKDRPDDKGNGNGGSKAKKGKDWAEQKEKLQKEVREKEIQAQKNVHFYTYGMLVGFILLAFASVLFLGSGQSTIRRVVGAIVLTAQVLWIFLTYLVGSSALTISSAFR